MKTLPPLLCLVLWLVAGRAVAAEPATLPSGIVADFEWFGTLGFPDVRGCPAVRVATGNWTRSGSNPPRNRYVAAFLLQHGEDSQFTVLTSDLFTRRFTATKPSVPEHEQVGYEEKSLADSADAYLAALAQPPGDERSEIWRRFGEQAAERVEVFTWAWACWRNGLDDRAAALYARADAFPVRPGREEKWPVTLRERLESDLGHAMIWRATLDFGDPKIPRTQLLEAFERVARDYPQAAHAALARETVERLRTMVAEDAAHASRPSAPLESLPTRERIDELIFRLRDQNGHQHSQPGYCDVFDDFGGALAKGNEQDAAHQLLAFGNAAVPPLIAALDDKDFSRSVGYWRNFAFSHHVLTVGDCAEQILQRIANRTFFTPKTSSSYLSKDGDVADVRAQAEAWWQSLQQKGERQTLIDTVSQGGRNAARQASLLLAQHPEAALAAMLQGARNSPDYSSRAVLLEELGKVPGDGAVPFLEEELRGSRYLAARLAAARALCLHGGRAEAVAAMIGEWEKSFADAGQREFGDDIVGTGVPNFLAQCGRVEAVQALGHRLVWRAENTRQQVIAAFRLPDADAPGPAPVETPAGQPGTDDKAAVGAAIEALLVAELADTEESSGSYFGLHFGQGYLQPRVCDFAGQALVRRYPDKYTFSGTGTLADNERVRVHRINVWRGEHGQTLLPPTPDYTIPPARDEEVMPPLRALAGSNDAAERADAAADLARVGLPALVPLRKFAATLPPDDPGRARLLAQERIMAQTVSATALTGAVADDAAWKPVREYLETLKGQPLRSAPLVALALEATGKLPWAADAFQLRVVRDAGIDGVRLSMELRAVAPEAKGAGSNAELHVEANLNGTALIGKSGGRQFNELSRSGEYADFARAVDKALGAAANEPFSCVICAGAQSP